MADSLTLAGYELMGRASAFSLAQGTFDLGAPQPDTTTISSLLLDGDAVMGDGTRNRTINLSLFVFPTSRSDLTAQVDALAKAVNVRTGKTFTLQWTPNGGQPVIFDCSRALVERGRSIVRDAQLVGVVSLTCQAQPFGRSPDLQTITVAAKSQVDSFDTAPTTGATLDTTVKIEGTGSAKVTGNLLGGTTYQPTAATSRTFTARDYSAYAQFVLQVGVQSPGDSSSVAVTLTLSSASGSTRYAQVNTLWGLLVGISAGWQAASIPLTGGTVVSGTGVTLSAVTGYSIAATAGHSGGGSTFNWWYDDMEATGSSSVITSTTRGELLLVPSVVGSARTPVSLAATGSIGALLVHRPPVDQDANCQILTGVTIAASPSTPAASTVAAVNAGYSGTYSAVLGVSGLGAGGSNTVAVTITQLENGASVATQTLTATYTSPAGVSDRLVRLGDVTLPLRAVPSDNTLTTYTFAFNHSAGADTYSDFMLLDTRGQSAVADPASSVAAVYLDAPVSPVELGGVYASAAGRTAAYSILDTAVTTGGPVLLEPGNNRLLVWSDAATPTLTVTYYPRWLDERAA